MEAFDTKVLEERLKEAGLPMVEGIVEKVADVVFTWAEESCMSHENMYVKAVGAPAIALVKPLIKEQIDKIDGEEG